MCYMVAQFYLGQKFFLTTLYMLLHYLTWLLCFVSTPDKNNFLRFRLSCLGNVLKLFTTAITTQKCFSYVFVSRLETPPGPTWWLRDFVDSSTGPVLGTEVPLIDGCWFVDIIMHIDLINVYWSKITIVCLHHEIVFRLMWSGCFQSHWNVIGLLTSPTTTSLL